MNIGLVYDLKNDYNVINDNYCDFSSLEEILHIKKTLLSAGFNIIDIGSPQQLVKILSKGFYNIDLIFNMAEGYKSRNREGLVPAVCELFNIKCLGTDSFGMTFSLHKTQTKLFLKSLGVSTANHFLFIPDIHNINKIEEYFKENHIDFPIILKPNHEGSSMGVTLVNSAKGIKDIISKLLQEYRQEILCEEYIYGNEMSVPLIETDKGIQILGIAEFADTNNEHLGIFTTEKKSRGFHIQKQPGMDIVLKEKIEKQSILIFKSMHFKSYARIDWIVRNNEPIFLEATPLPCFEQNNCFEWAAKENGMSFSEIIKRIINTYSGEKH